MPPHATLLDTPLDPCVLRHVCETEFGLSPFFEIISPSHLLLFTRAEQQKTFDLRRGWP